MNLVRCLAVLLVAGCASVPAHVPDPQVQKTAVWKPCVPEDFPKKPTTLSREALREMRNYDFVISVGIEWLELRAWSEKAEAVLTSCQKAPAD